jgi:hypothetical protein
MSFNMSLKFQHKFLDFINNLNFHIDFHHKSGGWSFPSIDNA